MKIAVGTDMDAPVVRTVVEELKRRGHDVQTFGALVETPAMWSKVAVAVAEKVANKEFDQAIVFCWTGTGISLAANKVKGIRATLCHDAETARGARLWNDANVLALSIRTLSEAVAKEILNAWFNTALSEEPEDVACLEWLKSKENA